MEPILQKAGLKFASTTPMAQCVMTIGMNMTLSLCASSWDSLKQVVNARNNVLCIHMTD